MAIVVRDVLRDREGLIGRVVGHLLIEAGVCVEHATISLVAVDRAGGTTMVERHGRADLVQTHAGRRAERLDFAIDVSRRLTPAFETPLGVRWWELRAAVGDARIEAVRQPVVVPDVRRIVRVSTTPAPAPEVDKWTRHLPALLRPGTFALDPGSSATGEATVRSRGDWGVVVVPDVGARAWQATILLLEDVDPGVGNGRSDLHHRSEVVYRRPLLVGPNTLEFELPRSLPPSHVGPLLTTSYELRVHTVDGRRLGACHRVDVLQ